MAFAGDLYARYRHRLHEIGKFGVIGVLGLIVTDGGFNLLHFGAGLGLFTSNIIATGVAVVITYLGNKYWTFAGRGNHGTGKETALFFVLSAIGALIQYAATWIAKNEFAATDKLALNVAFFLGIVVATVFRYWSYRTWVWGARAEPVPAPAVPPDDLTPPPGPPGGLTPPADRSPSHAA